METREWLQPISIFRGNNSWKKKRDGNGSIPIIENSPASQIVRKEIHVPKKIKKKRIPQ